METSILKTLNELPEIALRNIDSLLAPTSSTETKQKQISHILFGHLISIDEREKHLFDLEQKKQIIHDWVKAKNLIADMITHEGLEAKAIVPQKVFSGVLSTMNIVDLSSMNPDDGTIDTLDPFIIDHFIAEYFHIKFKTRFSLDLVKIFKNDFYPMGYNQGKITAKNFCRSNYNEIIGVNEWDHFPNPDERWLHMTVGIWNKDELQKSLFQNNFKAGTIDQKLVTELKELHKQLISFGSHAEIANFYNFIIDPKNRDRIYSKLKDSARRADTTKICFAELPVAFQKFMVQIKTKFPEWDLHTAADPHYFRMVSKGVDLLNLLQHRIKEVAELVSPEIIEDLIKKQDADRKINTEFQEKLASELGNRGIQQKNQYTILNEQDLLRAINTEADPIFFTPIVQEYKGIKHDIVIVWGQVGESPYEQKAIEELQKIDAELFMS